MSTTRAWIEAMRLRTLPVSTAGVVAAWALAVRQPVFRWMPALICLAFAIAAQIVSNFANEYYDYRDGLDKRGRSGPRRGVTEGDITPRAMKLATYCLLAVTSLLGLSLVLWGGWWLVIVGVVIALGALAYSAGPYPLSRHCLGEVMVILFFGIVPVNFTTWLVSGMWSLSVGYVSVAVGLLAANVLIVNNYRDADDDAAVGKHTLATRFGRDFVRWMYLLDAVVAALFTCIASDHFIPAAAVAVVGAYSIFRRLKLPADPASAQISALNPLLGMTACVMLLYALTLFI